jgi:tetratricopeptide (TPR) repeat protein
MSLYRHLIMSCGMIALGFFTAIHAEDFSAEVQAASKLISPVYSEINPLLAQGRVDEANARLLAVFPKETRTAVQCHLLANILYGVDSKLSYALQQEASQRLQDQPAVQMEWAMEQHRAGEYAGALASYDLFSKANPQFAPVHGLAADCLLRLGRTAEAVKRWQQSERAKRGTLINFETMVGEIYRDHGALARRVGWRQQTENGDVAAAVNLIVLVCDYPHDWWNRGVHSAFLAEDIRLLDRLPQDRRIASLRCLAASAQLLAVEDAKEADRRQILIDHGFIVDAQHTLPPDAAVASLLIGKSISGDLLTKADAKRWFLDGLLERVKASKDAALWNLVAFLLVDDDRLQSIEHDAWKATGDVRFAIGYLLERQKHGDLKATDTELLAAADQFPESSEIAHLLISLTPSPDVALLVRAIKSEYRHFTALNPAGFVERPGAWAMRSYFKTLATLNGKESNK